MSLKDFFLMLVTVAGFGMNSVAMKIGLEEFPPLLFNAMRFMMVFPFLFFISRPQMPWKALLSISFFLCIIQLSAMNISFTLGASAGTVILILQSGILFSLILSALFLKTLPKRYEVIGLIVGFLGLGLICFDKGTKGTGAAMALLVVAAMAWGICQYIIKREKSDDIGLAFWMYGLAFIPVFFGSLIIEGRDSFLTTLETASLYSWGAIASTALIFGVGASILWIHFMKKYPLPLVVPFGLLAPVFGCIFAGIFLGETIDDIMILGGGLSLLGILIIQLYPQLQEKFQLKEIQ